jgi:hypothetical protein
LGASCVPFRLIALFLVGQDLAGFYWLVFVSDTTRARGGWRGTCLSRYRFIPAKAGKRLSLKLLAWYERTSGMRVLKELLTADLPFQYIHPTLMTLLQRASWGGEVLVYRFSKAVSVRLPN